MIAMIAILPLGMDFGQILSPFSTISIIMKYAFVVTYIFILMVIDSIDCNMKYPRRIVVAILVVLSALIPSFVNTNNILYITTEQSHRATESYLTRLMARIENCPGYIPSMEIVIIDTIPYDQLHSQLESYARVNHYSVPPNNVAAENRLIYNYFNDWLNIPIPEPSEEVKIAVSNSLEFQAMPLYPEAGSIQIHNGRVIVKLSEYYTPKPAFLIGYENRK